MRLNTRLLVAVTCGSALCQETFEPTDFNITDALLGYGVDVAALPQLASLVERSSLAGCSIAVSLPQAKQTSIARTLTSFIVWFARTAFRLSTDIAQHTRLRSIHNIILVAATARTRPILHLQTSQTRASLHSSPHLTAHTMPLCHQIWRPRRICWRIIDRGRHHCLAGELQRNHSSH